ncbi:MAG TPA: hypothetical protein PLH54_09905, partial [Syntrophales bacterium]|nr:hypothetical protein [Syntrophales bacterium]
MAFFLPFTRKFTHMLLIYNGLSLTGPLRARRGASRYFHLPCDGTPSWGVHSQMRAYVIDLQRFIIDGAAAGTA